MSEIFFVAVVLLALIAALLAPIMLAMQLTRAKPAWSPWLVTALSALPTGLPFLAFAAWIAVTSDLTPCTNPPCENMAPLWFDVMLVLGVLALLVGFALAWFGRFVVRGRAKTQAE